MKREQAYSLSCVLVFLMSAPALAANVSCSDPAARVRVTESISFASPYCYTTITEAYASWYSLDLYARDSKMTDAGLTLDYSPDAETITLHGGDDANWNPTSGYTTVTGPVIVSGVSSIAIDRIIIE
ncbi:MAG: hypothetical protein M0024_09445 [Nitrospiraceae bacterium]|nr:hypothetical protein [Nitrospiraceae bacterium]